MRDLGSHSGTAEDEIIVGCEAVSLGKQLHRFEGLLCLNFQDHGVRRQPSLLRLLDHTNGVIITLLKVRNYSPNAILPCPRIPAPSLPKQFACNGFLNFGNTSVCMVWSLGKR